MIFVERAARDGGGAMIYPEPAEVGRGRKGKLDLPFSKMLLSQTRAVVPYPESEQGSGRIDWLCA
jgi:hypothetical protein